MTRYSRADALTERQFELLLRGARQLPDPQSFEARLIINCTAKLGMRGGEVAHLKTDWINWSDRMIEIPEHDPCDFGRDGGPCGYCRNRARDYMETHNPDVSEEIEAMRSEFGDVLDEEALRSKAVERVESKSMTFEEALARRWNPKTENSARSIPFDFDVRVQLCIEEFDEAEYDRFPVSKSTLNRRVKAAAQMAGIEANVYPHALRATAATIHASRNVSPHALMGVMGWDDMQTARTYISASEESAARELRSKHR